MVGVLMQKALAIFLVVAFLGIPLKSYSNGAVIVLDDDFFIIPSGCPLKPDGCSANPICDRAKVKDSGKARVIISADLAGISGVAGSDPDDIQSVAHLLTFSDRVDIEGLMSGPTRTNGSISDNPGTRARFNDLINGYESDRSKLIANYGNNFPDPNLLRGFVKDGSRFAHPIDGTPSYNNQAVQHIITQARCGWHNGDKRPLYLLSWGASTDLAQAMFLAPDIIPVVRLIAYSRHNNGDFIFGLGTCTNGSSGRTCDAWNYLRSLNDLWWIDYTGGTRPVGECDNGIISDILNGGALGSKIVHSHVAPHFETCSLPFSSPLNGSPIPWFKLGDTWTLMYTHNSASERDNPLSNFSGKYGSYTQPDPNRTYWRLDSTEFKGRSTLYSDWRARANNL